METYEGTVLNVQAGFVEVGLPGGKIVDVRRRLLPAAARELVLAVGQRVRVVGEVRGPSFRTVEAIEVLGG